MPRGPRKLGVPVDDRIVRRLRADDVAIDPPPSVAEYLAAWLSERELKDLSAIHSDYSRTRCHLVPELGHYRIDEIQQKHVYAMVDRLKSQPSKTGRKVSPRSLASMVMLLHSAMKDAERVGFRAGNPVVDLDMPKMTDADPTFRRRSIYTRKELHQIIAAPAEWLIRMIWALLFLTGCRAGEVFALRWLHLTEDDPLWRLSIALAYSTALAKVKATKTEIAREVPVHPALHKRLVDWKAKGWALTFKRPPKISDLIVPLSVEPEQHWNTRLFGLERIRLLESLGMDRRRTHDARRTFITLTQSDGAPRDTLRRVTHTRPKDVYDMYNETPWKDLCAAVSCLKVSL